MKSRFLVLAAIPLAAAALGACERTPAPAPVSIATATVTETETPTTTQPTASETVARGAGPAAYANGGNYYFTSPSGKWHCGIITSAKAVGCHGPFPSDAPRVPGAGAPDKMVAPNAIGVGNNDKAANFFSVGDPAYYPFSADGSVATARVLPYNEPLTVGDFTCRIKESTGVTCDNTKTGHGFTVSDSSYELR